VKKAIYILLNACLGLYLASGFVSALDDSLALLSGRHFLVFLSGVLAFFGCFTLVVTYFLMGITPMIPKRVFVPAALFYFAAMLAVFPVLIYCRDWVRGALWEDWVVSIGQVILGLILIRWFRGEWKFRWPFIEEKQLDELRFSPRNLVVFILANVFVLAPAVIVYFMVCAGLAVSHFTDGFVALRAKGIAVQVRNYVRSDGKRIELVPMAHVADADFYHKISQSFPTNSVVLLEGVSDTNNLLTNGISYKRMARSLGLVEQKENFKPQGKLVRADVDVDQFTTNTINLLNAVMLFHSKGMNPATMMQVSQFSMTPAMEDEVLNDLIAKRNQHLLQVLRDRLPKSDIIIVPWGAGHIPGIAREIQKDGFRQDDAREYIVMRWGSLLFARFRHSAQTQ